MKTITRIVIFSFISSTSVSAFAISAQSGPFVGVNTGWTSPQSNPSIAGYSTSDSNYNLGGSVGYNYAINKNVATALEANYTDFGKTNYSSNAGSGNFENSALQVLLSGTYLMDNGFNTFVKVGAAYEQSALNISNGTSGVTSWLPAAAAGLGYEVIQNLNIYGEYERTFGTNWQSASPTSTPSKAASLNIFSIGVNYNFPM